MNELSPQEVEEYRQLKKDAQLRSEGLELSAEERGVSKSDMQQLAGAKHVFNNYDIVRVEAGDKYYQRRNNIDSYTYDRLSDRQIEDMARDSLDDIGIPATARKIKDTAATIKAKVASSVSTIDLTLIEVVPGLYWDSDSVDFTDTPDRPCFIRLFDNTGFEGSQSIINVEMPDSYGSIIKGYYKETLRWLDLMGGDLPDPSNEEDIEEHDKNVKGYKDKYPLALTFPFIWTWACEEHGPYMDMLKMIASVFMKKKPMGAFILTGLKRNGKSTMVKLIHTMLGRANTSSVRLSELSDTHKNLTLTTTLFNAPDEETEGKDMDADAVANFKTMAAHEPLLLPVLYETKPQWVQTNFVSVSPMNTEPEWKGDSASACMQRSLIIQFHADLSKFDNSGRDFARETFTAEMYSQLLGVAFALAHYYSDKKLTFSDEMADAREIIEEQVDNRIEYADLFNKWFVGYRTEKDVYNDYKAWCREHNCTYVKMKSLMFAIKERGHGVHKTNLSRNWSDVPVRAYRIGPSRKGTYLIPEEYIDELGCTIEDYSYISGEPIGRSVVTALENWLSRKQVQEVKDGE